MAIAAKLRRGQSGLVKGSGTIRAVSGDLVRRFDAKDPVFWGYNVTTGCLIDHSAALGIVVDPADGMVVRIGPKRLKVDSE